MMRILVATIEGEFRRYKQIAEDAIRQLSEAELGSRIRPTDSSVAIIAWHIGGNLKSRFTDFLTSDGEKPWRDRDSEFSLRQGARDPLLAHWDGGWSALRATLEGLTDEDLPRIVRIRDQPLSVHEALQRSLAHTSYHVGQIVFIAKSLRGGAWQFLSIPPGQSAHYSLNPIRRNAR